MLFRDFIEEGSHHFTGPAPVGVEIDQDRDFGLQHRRIEMFLIDFDGAVEEERFAALGTLGLLIVACEIDLVEGSTKLTGQGSVRHRSFSG